MKAVGSLWEVGLAGGVGRLLKTAPDPDSGLFTLVPVLSHVNKLHPHALATENGADPDTILSCYNRLEL